MLHDPLDYPHEEDDDFDVRVGKLCALREQDNRTTGRVETDDEIFEAITRLPEFRALLVAHNPDLLPLSEEQHHVVHQIALDASTHSTPGLSWTTHCPTTTDATLDKGIVCPFTTEFRQLATLIPANTLVLEIGCSYGKATEILANSLEMSSQVVGIDISKETITSASKEYPHIKFVQADCLRDPMSTLRVHEELCALHTDLTDLVVFVDIGGNRELESLVVLLPWIEKQLNPTTIVVKSETLHAAVTELPSMQCCGQFDWHRLHTIAMEALQKRKELQTKADGATPVQIKSLHPLKAPLRTTNDGTPICRFHNYDPRGCRKFIDATCSGETCPYDHTVCHICLQKDHIALNCTLGKPLI